MKAYMIGCSAGKCGQRAEAKDMYTGDLFLKSREYAEKKADGEWFILSAKYGLIRPTDVINPYELTLNTFNRDDLQLWAEHVAERIRGALPPGTEIVFLCGSKYRDDLMRALGNDYTYTTPMQGMGIGSQKKWLKEQNVLFQ